MNGVRPIPNNVVSKASRQPSEHGGNPQKQRAQPLPAKPLNFMVNPERFERPTLRFVV